MSVLLPNTWLAVRRQGTMTRDSHGDLIPSDWQPASAALPGRASGGGANLQGGEDVFMLALDPALWPLVPKDIVVEFAGGDPTVDDSEPGTTLTGREWTVRTADMLKHSEDSSVDYVRVQGQLRAGTSTMP